MNRQKICFCVLNAQKIIYLHSILLIVSMLKSKNRVFKKMGILAEKVEKNAILYDFLDIRTISHQITIR